MMPYRFNKGGVCTVDVGADWKVSWGERERGAWSCKAYAYGEHTNTYPLFTPLLGGEFGSLAEEYSAMGTTTGKTLWPARHYGDKWKWRNRIAEDLEMRRAARVDSNQATIVKALRAAGCKVRSLASVGDGLPDLLVGYRGVLCLLEVKDGAKPPSARKLTPDELAFFEEWSEYPVFLVENEMQALLRAGVELEVVGKTIDASRERRP